jgi:hypothetical protein
VRGDDEIDKMLVSLDHSVTIGERLRYMLTGNVESISREIGP